MNWRSRQGLLAFVGLVGLINLTAWAAQAAIPGHRWVPFTACMTGLTLLFATRCEPGGRAVPAYSLALCVLDPVRAVGPHDWWAPPAFVLLLAPLARAGTIALARGHWWRAAGAWLVLLGQFFCLIYNATHPVFGIGVHAGMPR